MVTGFILLKSISTVVFRYLSYRRVGSEKIRDSLMTPGCQQLEECKLPQRWVRTWGRQGFEKVYPAYCLSLRKLNVFCCLHSATTLACRHAAFYDGWPSLGWQVDNWEEKHFPKTLYGPSHLSSSLPVSCEILMVTIELRRKLVESSFFLYSSSWYALQPLTLVPQLKRWWATCAWVQRSSYS